MCRCQLDRHPILNCSTLYELIKLKKNFNFRLGVLQSCTAFGSILGSIMSPYLCSKSYTYAFTTSSICAMAGLLYASIYLKETIVIIEVNIYF